MKKVLTFGTLLLGCCLAATAQTTPNQTPPVSTPPTFPQDQTGQASPADRSAIPPDTNAPETTSGEAAGRQTQMPSSQMTSLQGCLSQSQAGNFILADISGNSFQLSGDTAKLAGYIGNQVKVDGIALPARPGTGSMSSPASTDSGSSPGTAAEFSVSKIHKMADSCATGSDSSK